HSRHRHRSPAAWRTRERAVRVGTRRVGLMAAPLIVRVRRTPGGVDEYGDPIPSSVTRTPLPTAFVAPRLSDEITNRGRAGVVVGLTLYDTNYKLDLRHTDQVEVDGELYEVDGEPGRWRNPMTGREAGIQVALRRAQG